MAQPPHREIVTALLSDAVDSFEKLHITIYLYRSRFGSRSTATIAQMLELAPGAAGEALTALARVGVVRSMDPEGAGWWFDPNGVWGSSVEVLAQMYETERIEVFDLMTRAALARLRTHAADIYVETRALRVRPSRG